MERNYRKYWALLASLLFFLLFISLAVPANEKENQFNNHTNASMKLETEDKQNKASHLNMFNNITDNPDDKKTFLGEKFIEHRTKRPARMLPHHILYGPIKNDADEVSVVKEFYGPPTSCDDLATLGYTLNGNYLVNGKDVPDNQHKVEMIACYFKKPPGLEGEGIKIEERFGIILEASSKIAVTLTSNGTNITKEIIGRLNKRPARLIPFKDQVHYMAEKHVTDKKFYGPASNCDELRQLGYTLNGYYLLQGKEKVIGREVEIVYCQFKRPKSLGSISAVSKIEELRLGFINLSPSGINTAVDTSKNIRHVRSINTFIDQLFKRPARLLPLKIIFGDGKNITKTPRFYGPAYNCDDLGKLGYTLNGYYMVDSHENSSNGIKEVVLCRFKQSLLGEQAKKEQRLGFTVKADALPTYAKGVALTAKDGVYAIAGEKLFCTIKPSPSLIDNPHPSIGVVGYTAGSLISSSRNGGSTHVERGDDVKNGTCYLLLSFIPTEAFQPRFLGIKDYSEGKPVLSETMLITRRMSGAGTPGDSIWVQRDMHFCSFVGDQCLSLIISNGKIKIGQAVTLTPYNGTDPYQKWEIKSNLEDISVKVITNVETKFCLTYDYVSTNKEIRVKFCDETHFNQGWQISLFQDTPENRQNFLKIKKFSFKSI